MRFACPISKGCNLKGLDLPTHMEGVRHSTVVKRYFQKRNGYLPIHRCGNALANAADRLPRVGEVGVVAATASIVQSAHVFADG